MEIHFQKRAHLKPHKTENVFEIQTIIKSARSLSHNSKSGYKGVGYLLKFEYARGGKELSYNFNPSEAQERHGDYQIVLNTKRKKLAESLAAKNKIEKKITLASDDVTALVLLEAELADFCERIKKERNALEECELVAERYLYEWVLAIWSNRKADLVRLTELTHEIEIKIEEHRCSAELAETLQSKSRYLQRIENLECVFTQLKTLMI